MPVPHASKPFQGKTTQRVGAPRLSVGLLCAALFVLTACQTTTPTPPPDEEIPLPTLGSDANDVLRGTHAVIRRVDLPLNQPTDDAWDLVNEMVVPTLTRGAWRGNGLRLGLLNPEQIDAYADALPKPIAYGETVMNQSVHPVPVIETARLSPDLLFEIDLTRPPMPRNVEDIAGGKNSTLRLLARIETDDAGKRTLVLTPHHYVPSPYDLIPRHPLAKELDGRIFTELTVRLVLEPGQVAVVGLHWPWPLVETLPPEIDPEADPEAEPAPDDRDGTPRRPRVLPVFNPDDPAAPPPHITGTPKPENESDSDTDKTDGDTQPGNATGNTQNKTPGYERIAPPLPRHFGSTLLTGTRTRQPVRTVLLITIENPTVDTNPESVNQAAP